MHARPTDTHARQPAAAQATLAARPQMSTDAITAKGADTTFGPNSSVDAGGALSASCCVWSGRQSAADRLDAFRRHVFTRQRPLRISTDQLTWPRPSSARCSQQPRRARSGRSQFSGTTCTRGYCGSCEDSTRWQRKMSKPTPGSPLLEICRAFAVTTRSSARGCSRSHGTVSSTGEGAKAVGVASP